MGVKLGLLHQGKSIHWVLENRMLRKVFKPNREEVTGEWRNLHNEKLLSLIQYIFDDGLMSILSHILIRFSPFVTAQHKTTQYKTTQHNTTQHNTAQHNTTQHNTNHITLCFGNCFVLKVNLFKFT
jgi:hypothetical protein